ncbi:MAG TPA: hypothetical protein VNI58_03340 [Mariprofundaceae bacterium]|nr:hypothetical protein [Mariprofundaceae bacterium]
MQKSCFPGRFPATGSITRWNAAVLLWLLFLTFVSLTSDYLQTAPFDARTGEHVAGLSLSYPTWGAVIEPFAAVAEILGGAPDMRKAVLSTLVWCLLLPFLFALLQDMGNKAKLSRRARFRRAASISLTATLCFAMYLAFTTTVKLPTWVLHDDNASDVQADLHTHTFYSHDGLVSPEDNLAHHREIGNHVVVFSDHGMHPHNYNLDGVITGTEQGVAKGDFHVIGVGLIPDKFVPVALFGKPELKTLVKQIHEVHHGAVIAMTEHLKPEDIPSLVALGIDGFEIFNQGYTPPSNALKTALLEAQKRHGIVLVADSDWHGWGTLNQQWTVFRTGTMTGDTPEKIVINSLREHLADSVIPVTANHEGQVSTIHTILSPLFEVFRYAQELSLLRLAAWWIWGILFILAVRLLKAQKLAPAPTLGALMCGSTGAVMLAASLYRLYTWLPFDGTNVYGRNLFLLIICLSLVCLAVSRMMLQKVFAMQQSQLADRLEQNKPAYAE